MWREKTRNNTSLSGWEYLVTMKGLGFESYVCVLGVILITLMDKTKLH